MARYPTRDEIRQLFDNLSNGKADAFFDRVAPDVDWTVMGTHPLAGRYTTLSAFREATFARLNKIMKPPGTQLAVRNIISGGQDEPWAVVELIINAECLDGFKFDNTYAWCVRFNEQGIIVEVRAYLDSWSVREAIVRNEVPSHRAEIPQVKDLAKHSS